MFYRVVGIDKRDGEMKGTERKARLDKAPLDLKDTLTETAAGQLLERSLGQVQIALIAVLAWAHVYDCDNDRGRGTLGSDRELLTTNLGTSAHLCYWQERRIKKGVSYRRVLLGNTTVVQKNRSLSIPWLTATIISD